MAHRTNVLKVRSERSNHIKYVIVEIPKTENNSSIKCPYVAYVVTYWLGKLLIEKFTGVLHINLELELAWSEEKIIEKLILLCKNKNSKNFTGRFLQGSRNPA